MRQNQTRRPGEAIFTGFLALASFGLLLKAYGISGFEALSSAGALPMGAAGVMSVTAGMIAWRAFRATPDPTQSIAKDILPGFVLITIFAITAYAFLLKPVGFLLTSFIFLAVLIKVLSKRAWFFCLWVSAANVILIYLVFRILFSVLMPEGLVPERDIIAAIGRFLAGGR
jgi:putative tricarboxylic transport membrane protein